MMKALIFRETGEPQLQASPGIEGVGIVESVGPGVQGPMIGTRVVFVDTWNTWREQIVLLQALCGND
jgi:NADPH:quinone reductase-like Zn-dependent oxidoreductase